MPSKSNSYWQRRKEARKRWSLNAVRAKARIKAKHVAASMPDEPDVNVLIPRKCRPDLKVIIERKDGMKVQYSLHIFYGKLIGQHVQMSPKQFGRKLGEMFQLWATP